MNRQEAAMDILALNSLDDNWNSYGAPAPSELAIADALFVSGHLYDEGLVIDRVLSSAEGGVGLCFLDRMPGADVEFFNSGEILAAIYHIEEPTEVWDVREYGLKLTAQRIKNR